MKRAAIERWEEGTLDLASEKEIRSAMSILQQVADLPFEAVASFYEQIDELNKEREEAA